MNIINFKVVLSILITFLSMSVYPIDKISENKDAIQLVKDRIKEISKQIDNDAKEIKKLDDNHLLGSIYIVLGVTGEGKSTLINFLGKNSSIVVKEIREMPTIDVEIPFTGMKVGHNSSETSVPVYWYDKDSKIVYYDVPGFAATGSNKIKKEVAEIIDTYSINKLFQALPRDKIKIMLVMSEGSIDSRGPSFSRSISAIGGFFKNHPKEVANGTCIVVTKQNLFITHKPIKERLSLTSDNGEGSYTKESLVFLKELQSSKIVFFPRPTRDEIGQSLTEGKWSKVREAIASALTNTSNFSKEITPTLDASDEAKEYIPILSKDEFDKIKEFIINDVVKEIEEFCWNKITTTQINSQEFRADFTKLSIQLKELIDLSIQLKNLDVDNIDQFMQKMKDVFVGGCDRADLYNEIKISVDNMLFFKELNKSVVFPLKELVSALSNIQGYIAELGKDPKFYILDSSDVLQIVGLLVGTSDIPSPLINDGKYKGRDIKRVDVYGLNTLWLDSNITSHGKEDKNGLSFSFIAPKWKIVNKVTIDLNGEDGKDGVNGINGVYPGAHGSDGAPGRPGGNGGSFYGKGMEFGGKEHLELLTINTSGGKGGNGGNGGNGADGYIGNDGNCAKKIQIEDGETHKVWVCNDSGASGSNGGNAGQGGAKGLSGNKGKGNGNIYGATADYVHYNYANDGREGNHGRVGKKGEHGKDCNGREDESCSCGTKRCGNWNWNELSCDRKIPSTKQALLDGQLIDAFNSDGRIEPIKTDDVLDINNIQQLETDYIVRCKQKQYENNTFVIKDDWCK